MYASVDIHTSAESYRLQRRFRAKGSRHLPQTAARTGAGTRSGDERPGLRAPETRERSASGSRSEVATSAAATPLVPSPPSVRAPAQGPGTSTRDRESQSCGQHSRREAPLRETQHQPSRPLPPLGNIRVGSMPMSLFARPPPSSSSQNDNGSAKLRQEDRGALATMPHSRPAASTRRRHQPRGGRVHGTWLRPPWS